jgi:hypothetical protein
MNAKTLWSCAGLVVLLFVYACATRELRVAGSTQGGGPVPRGTYQINYSALLLDFYRNDPRMHQGAGAAPVGLKVPARVAVAQLGEMQAASTLLAELRRNSEILAGVASIPAVPPDLAGFYDYTEQSVSLGGTEKRTAPKPSDKDSLTPKDFLQELRLLSLDLGSDYLFVYGGSIDFRTKHDTLAKILDLTIIGAFVIPSDAHSLQGRAIGLLIDVKQNRIVMSVSSDTAKQELASTRYSQDTLRNLITEIRVELQKNLAQDFVKTFTARALQARSQELSKN